MDTFYAQTWIRLHVLQMLLDQDGPFKRAPGEFALRIPICILWWRALFLFHADQHFREEEALELLPRLAVFTDSHSAVEPQSSKSDMVNDATTGNLGNSTYL